MELLTGFEELSSQTTNSSVIDPTTKLFTAFNENSEKVIIKRFDLTKDSNREFNIECFSLSQISHPNIVPMINVIKDENYGYIVLPFAEGGDLFDAFIKDSFKITDYELKIFAYNLITSINICHGQGIIHRDLKPENIVLRSKGSFDPSKFYIIDFGSSYNNCCPSDSFRSTLIYSPPEYVWYRFLNEKFDIWSIGVILYMLVSKLLPFEYKEGMTPQELENLLTDKSYMFGSPEWNDISEGMKNLILEMLTVNVNQRPSARRILTSNVFAEVEDPNFDDLYEFDIVPFY